VTEYAHDGSFDQEIFIRRIKNPNKVYLDPDIQSGDGADAKFAFVFEDMTREEFEGTYPDEIAADVFPESAATAANGLCNDRIRIASTSARRRRRTR
jgi:hypothetical protein